MSSSGVYSRVGGRKGKFGWVKSIGVEDGRGEWFVGTLKSPNTFVSRWEERGFSGVL